MKPDPQQVTEGTEAETCALCDELNNYHETHFQTTY